MDTLKMTPLAPLLISARLKIYIRGQIIIYQNEIVESIYLLDQGEVTLYGIDERGSAKILHILKAPAIFPMAYPFAGEKGIFGFYGALSHVKLYSLPYAAFEKELLQNNRLAMYVFRQRALAMHELLVRLDSLGKTSVRSKLLAALRFLAQNHADHRRGVWSRVPFPVTHQLLADLTGITRESATVSIRQLQQDKLIRYAKQMVLEIDSQRVVKAH